MALNVIVFAGAKRESKALHEEFKQECCCNMELTWTGITCKKIPCYMCDSACRWFIVKKAKIFWMHVK